MTINNLATQRNTGDKLENFWHEESEPRIPQWQIGLFEQHIDRARWGVAYPVVFPSGDEEMTYRWAAKAGDKAVHLDLQIHEDEERSQGQGAVTVAVNDPRGVADEWNGTLASWPHQVEVSSHAGHLGLVGMMNLHEADEWDKLFEALRELQDEINITEQLIHHAQASRIHNEIKRIEDSDGWFTWKKTLGTTVLAAGIVGGLAVMGAAGAGILPALAPLVALYGTIHYKRKLRAARKELKQLEAAVGRPLPPEVSAEEIEKELEFLRDPGSAKFSTAAGIAAVGAAVSGITYLGGAPANVSVGMGIWIGTVALLTASASFSNRLREKKLRKMQFTQGGMSNPWTDD